MPQEDEETNPPIVISSDEDGQKDQEEEHTKEEEPLSLPQKKRKGNYPTCTPQSCLPTPHLEMMAGKQKVSLDWSPQMKAKTP